MLSRKTTNHGDFIWVIEYMKTTSISLLISLYILNTNYSSSFEFTVYYYDFHNFYVIKLKYFHETL